MTGQSVSGIKTPVVAVDGVVLCRNDADPGRSHWKVLLVRRANPPFQGDWAFPGGFVDVGEGLAAAVGREVEEETGLRNLPLRQFRSYGNPHRDPRGHTVSVVHVAELSGCPPDVVGGDDAAEARWFALDGLPDLAFDHHEILDEIMIYRRETI